MISSYISQYIFLYTYLVCCLYLRLSLYIHIVTYHMLVQMGSSLVGFHSKGCNGVLHALARICWSEWLKVDGKNCENYSDLIFVWGAQSDEQTLKCLCVVPCFIGKSHVPQDLGFPPPPLCFPGGQNVHEIHHLCELSLQGLLAVLVESKLLIPMVFSWEDVDINLIKGIHVWWKLKISKNEKWWAFFPGAWGSICVLWSFPNNKSPTESPSFGKDTKMLQPTNHVEHNSSLDNFTSWEAEGLHIQFANLCLPRWLKF